MPREIDERKKRKILRRLERTRRALEDAEASGNAEEAAAIRASLSDWEADFIASVQDRLETFGSAFADPEKGDLESPLSRLQEAKLKELEKKAKGEETRPWMKRSSFKSKGAGFKSKSAPPRASGRDINDDLEPPASPQERQAPRIVRASELERIEREEENGPEPGGPPRRAAKGPRFTVIKGGKDED